MSSTSLSQWGVMAALAILSIIFGAMPYFLLRKLKGMQNMMNSPSYHLTITVLSCVGGGVLFATTFSHMLPENRANLESIETNFDPHFPLAEILTTLGFLFIYFLEELANYLMDKPKSAVDSAKTLQDDAGCNPPAQAQVTVVADAEQKVEATNEIVTKLKFGSLLALLALSFHAIMEGIAIGIQDSNNLWLMFSAIASHKFLISFCMGMELCAGKANLEVYAGSVLLFAVLSPLGIFIGSILSGESSVTSMPLCVLEGFATGTLLYIVFFEIFSREKERRQTMLSSIRSSGFLQFIGFLVGTTAMISLLTFVNHGHSHGHGHEHCHCHWHCGDHDDGDGNETTTETSEMAVLGNQYKYKW